MASLEQVELRIQVPTSVAEILSRRATEAYITRTAHARAVLIESCREELRAQATPRQGASRGR